MNSTAMAYQAWMVLDMFEERHLYGWPWANWCCQVSQWSLLTFDVQSKYEWLMVKWIEHENGTFECLEPQLGSGEMQALPLFQDDSSFHAGKYKSNVWLVHSLHLMVSFLHWLGKAAEWWTKADEEGLWVNHSCVRLCWEENGHLAVQDQDRAIIKDMQCITYPGANADAWWDLPQLLTHVIMDWFRKWHSRMVSRRGCCYFWCSCLFVTVQCSKLSFLFR